MLHKHMCARGHSNMSTSVHHVHTNLCRIGTSTPRTCTTDEVIMTAWCCFVLLMLIHVNDATVGTVCLVGFHHRNTCFTLHILMSWRTVMCLPVPFPDLCSLLLSRWPRGSSYGNLWEAESLKAHTVKQPASTLIDVRAGAHTHTQAHTCTQRERAEDHWSVKWFCYHVACVEYIFPSTFYGRCACVCLMGCWCCVHVCVFCGSLHLSVVEHEELLGGGVSIKTTWQC